MAGAGGAALLNAVGAGRAFAQAPPDLEALYAPPSTADVALSPSGDRIAILRNRTTAKGVVQSWIEIADARDPAGPRTSLNLGDHETNGISWAHETRLMVWVVYDVRRKGFPPESIVRVITLADDGTKPAVMFGNRGGSLQYIHDLGTVVDSLPGDPDNVLMRAWEPQRGLPGLYRVNVNTGAATVVEYGALRTGTWLTQDGTPMIRLDADRRGSMVRIMARARGETDWKFVHAFRDDQAPEFSVFGATEKPGVFLGAARMPGEDKISIREVELTSLKIGPPLLTPASVDAGGVLFDRLGRPVALSWREDRNRYQFIDAELAPHFERLEASLGPDHSLKLLELSDNHARWLAVASGPREPGRYVLYDTATRAVTELGRSQPDLTPERLGPMASYKVRTRDGADVPAYLTRPASGRPGPLVVMPHGGPESRDDWGYAVWTQAMAAKGWWVLQVNFRGSGGYGLAYAKAGWRRWGDRMQEDIEDAIADAVAKHGLDAGRVAIMGGSYGGYAALMGAVRRPDLYRAVVSIAGVSDLVEMLKWEQAEDDTPGQETVSFWRSRIGDPVADAEMLARASPRRRAAEVKAPVLLIHGTWDVTVPVVQSRLMAEALTQAGKTVDLWEMKREGHQSSSATIDREILTRCLAFLEAGFARA